jgi:hypothetical protein
MNQAPGDAPCIGVFELFSYLSTHVPADAQHISYQLKPLAQEPLLYAHQLDQNFAVALRPGWQGGTLDADLTELIRELASYNDQLQVSGQLIQRRNELIARLEV